ncbi:MAG: ABC transporter substrate-binding protein [Candidatus Dormibacteraceae bacterium]
MKDERRVVTVVFADLAGSTALAERLDPEEVRLIIGEGIARAVAAIEAYGGTVKDLAGDGVLALFGAPRAHEDDPERAVLAALEIVAAVADHGEGVRRGWGIAGFGARAAVHTGEVVTGLVGAGGRIEYAAFGDAVNTAARLQSHAPVGAVLVSETTRRLVAGLFEWGPAEAFDLKGKVSPVSARVAIGARSHAAASTEILGTAPLTGRDRELGVAEELVERLSGGRGGLLFVVGDPGIGKSRLAAETARLVGAKDCAWLEGRCVSYGEGLSYWPFRDLIRNWLRVTGQEPEMKVRVGLRRRLDGLLGDEAAESYPHLAAILGLSLEPAAAAGLAELSPEALQFRTFEVVLNLLRRLAEEHPLALLLDDLHWADRTSLALTERLLALSEEAPFLLVVTMRPETDRGAWTLKERAQREYRHLYAELDLEPLTRERETELLRTLVEVELPPEVVDRVLAYTEGNPFYLEEITRTLAEDGEVAIPDTLEGVIQARLDRLEPSWRRIVTAAAVLGRTFPQELLGHLYDGTEEELREGLHHLLRLEMLQQEQRLPEPVYRFRHALLQEAAQRSLVSADRADLHRRAALWFEGHYGDRQERMYGLLAHHWLAADDEEKAILYLRLAGEQARSEWALDEAVRHYQLLAPLLDRSGREAEAAAALFELALTLNLAMRFAEADATWQRAFLTQPVAAPVIAVGAATLVLMVRQLAWDPDPATSFYSANQRLHIQTHGSLLEQSEGGSIVPGMAEWWTVTPDGRCYRVRLRTGLVWHDGRPVTAADVVDGVRLVLDPQIQGLSAPYAFVLENAEERAAGRVPEAAVGVRAVGDLEVEFRLSRAVPYFPSLLTLGIFSGLRQDGTSHGPFEILEMSPTQIVLERASAGGWRGIGNVRRVEMRAMPSDEGAIGTGVEVDAWLESPGPALPPMKADQIVTELGPFEITAFLVWSGSLPGIDVHLRRALALATDRSLIEADQPPTRMTATGGLVPPALPGHTPGVALRYDPAAARESLSRSGFAGPLRIAWSLEQKPPYRNRLVESWRQVLGLEIEVLDFALVENVKFHHQAHLAFWHWAANWPDPEYFIRLMLHGQSRTNLSGWRDERLDALIDRAMAQEDGAARLALFHDSDRLAVQELCQVLPMQYLRGSVHRQPWVSGLYHPYLSHYKDVIVGLDSPRSNG